MRKLQSLVRFFLLFSLAYGQDCETGQFQCDNGNCIPASYVCDGDNDCGDMSDEPEDCPPCRYDYWQCSNGNCIPVRYICDGDNDCGDMSDELDQETGTCPRCPDTHFQCGTGRCIVMNYVCDGDNDCGDMSDEPSDPELCPACREGEFRCTNGRCISNSSICDGRDNCGDMSDEPSDPDKCPACREGQFRCLNGRCISENSFCDGRNDCGNWQDEDENLCPCADDEFRCDKPPSEEPSAPGPCIPEEWVCDEDGIWDCPDGSDQKNCSLSASPFKNHPQGRRGSEMHFRSNRKVDQQKHKKSHPLQKFKSIKKLSKGKQTLHGQFLKKKSLKMPRNKAFKL